MSTQTKDKTDWDNLTDGLWQTYEHLSNGEQAELRRGIPSEPFWRLLARIGKEDASTDDLSKWRVLIQCIAIAGYSGVPFGVALWQMGASEKRKQPGYSRQRLKRLLEADKDQLPDLLRRTAKQLRSADQKANWNAARKLLFYEGEYAEKARLKIAREYYTYTDDSNQDSDSNE